MFKGKRLIVIDSNSLIHRAYHALPRLTTKKGELVNAVYGFLLVFFKAIREFQPDYIVASFDSPGPTFRHKKYKKYKAKRPPAPEELYKQIPKVKEVLKVFGVPIFEKEGFEADDIIGTISKVAPKKQIIPEIETIILSGDSDTLQLIDAHTKVYALKKGVKETVLYDVEKFKERYQGLQPEQLSDLRALEGDPSDNIPGVAGIGEKTAIKLIKEFKNLENLYQSLEKKNKKIKELKPKLVETLLQSKEQAFFSKMLATIRKDVPINLEFKKCSFEEYNKEKVIQIFKDFGFRSLIKRLPGAESEIEKSQDEKDTKIGKNLRLW